MDRDCRYDWLRVWPANESEQDGWDPKYQPPPAKEGATVTNPTDAEVSEGDRQDWKRDQNRMRIGLAIAVGATFAAMWLASAWVASALLFLTVVLARMLWEHRLFGAGRG